MVLSSLCKELHSLTGISRRNRDKTAILLTLALIMLELQFFQANVFNRCINEFGKAICSPTPSSPAKAAVKRLKINIYIMVGLYEPFLSSFFIEIVSLYSIIM